MKKSVIQTIFKESKSIQELQDWSNEFLRDHEAVNLQVCKNETDNLQMMIVYRTEIEFEDDEASNVEVSQEVCE